MSTKIYKVVENVEDGDSNHWNVSATTIDTSNNCFTTIELANKEIEEIIKKLLIEHDKSRQLNTHISDNDWLKMRGNIESNKIDLLGQYLERFSIEELHLISV